MIELRQNHKKPVGVVHIYTRDVILFPLYDVSLHIRACYL